MSCEVTNETSSQHVSAEASHESSTPPRGSAAARSAHTSFAARLQFLTDVYAGRATTIAAAVVMVIPAAVVAAFALRQWRRRERRRSFFVSEVKNIQQSHTANTANTIIEAQINRKKDFLKRVGDDYGYQSSPAGHIDKWRQQQFPLLIPPINTSIVDAHGDSRILPVESSCSGVDSENDSYRHEPEVYLDYAGSALPTRSQMNNIVADSLSSGVLANPHSTGPAASRTMVRIEQAKKLVMDHFHAHPGRSYGIGEHSMGKMADDDSHIDDDHHPGYDIIFTSGATESLRIVAGSFQWTPGSDGCSCSCHMGSANCNSRRRRKRGRSVLLYPHNAHTSVIGMRGPALANGGTFRCVRLNKLNVATAEDFASWADDCVATDKEEAPPASTVIDDNLICGCCESNCKPNEPDVNNLLVLPAECNFGGNRPDNIAGIISQARRPSQLSAQKSRWYVMLDLAKAASTGPIDLRKLNPDFACLSFYKMFGEPTGLGVLFVKRTSMDVLVERGLRYFGGGSVDAVLAGQDFVQPRSEPSTLPSFVHGTVHFRGIASLPHGFKELRCMGGMEKIFLHSRSLAREFVRRLRQLKHFNGQPVAVIYGSWSEYNNDGSAGSINHDTPGPTVAFNIMRHDGSIIGYYEVSNLAGLNTPPIQLRTGCFCNAGACQKALELSDEKIKDNYYQEGHVCGDKKDIIKGSPTGAIRVSFGKDSTWEDLDALIMFLGSKFVNNEADPVRSLKCSDGERLRQIAPTDYKISELFVFPIKSCAAMRVERWKMSTRTGRLLYDREFALVDSSGAAMRLHSFPKMGRIKPSVDLERGILRVSAPECDDLKISLDEDENHSLRQKQGEGHIRVCGSKACARAWGGDSASAWFSSYLGLQCWLVRHNGTMYAVDVAEDGGDTLVSATVSSSFSTEKERSKAFANDAALLLVSQDSINKLNAVLASQGSRSVVSRHFRPNIVVTRAQTGQCELSCSNPEDSWSVVKVEGKNLELRSDGHCARCQMVDVDPTSGMKGGKTLRALAEYRRRGGQIVFGIFLSMWSGDKLQNEYEWIEQDDKIRCYY